MVSFDNLAAWLSASDISINDISEYILKVFMTHHAERNCRGLEAFLWNWLRNSSHQNKKDKRNPKNSIFLNWQGGNSIIADKVGFDTVWEGLEGSHLLTIRVTSYRSILRPGGGSPPASLLLTWIDLSQGGARNWPLLSIFCPGYFLMVSTVPHNSLTRRVL